MTNPPFWKKLLRPEGLLVLLAAFWGCMYVAITYFSDFSLFWHLQIYWPEPTLTWPLLLLAFAAAYYLTRGFRQWKILQYIHVVSLATIPVMLYWWAPHWGAAYAGYQFTAESEGPATLWLAIAAKMFVPLMMFNLLGQLAFLVNLIAGFVRGKKSTS